MTRYDLKYAGNEPGTVDTLSFEARSFGGALDIAKKLARGEWAELYENGRAICHLELVSESGVWLVGGPQRESATQKIEIPTPLPV